MPPLMIEYTSSTRRKSITISETTPHSPLNTFIFPHINEPPSAFFSFRLHITIKHRFKGKTWFRWIVTSLAVPTLPRWSALELLWRVTTGLQRLACCTGDLIRCLRSKFLVQTLTPYHIRWLRSSPDHPLYLWTLPSGLQGRQPDTQPMIRHPGNPRFTASSKHQPFDYYMPFHQTCPLRTAVAANCVIIHQDILMEIILVTCCCVSTLFFPKKPVSSSSFS
jgi:hypothetical protein